MNVNYFVVGEIFHNGIIDFAVYHVGSHFFAEAALKY